MPFLPPNQQRQSTEGRHNWDNQHNYKHSIFSMPWVTNDIPSETVWAYFYKPHNSAVENHHIRLHTTRKCSPYTHTHRSAGARRNLLDFMVQGKITEADTTTIRLGHTPSGLISNLPPSSPHFYAGYPSCSNPPLYPGLGQEPSKLACIPSGMWTINQTANHMYNCKCIIIYLGTACTADIDEATPWHGNSTGR